MNGNKILQNVFLNVSGVNGETKQEKAVTASFTGEGVQIGAGGQPDPNLPALSIPEVPSQLGVVEFNAAEYRRLLETDAQAANEMLMRFQASIKPVSESDFYVALRRNAVDFCVQHHGFRREDGDWFVITEEDVDLSEVQLKPAEDGSPRVALQVAVAAKFGRQE